MSICLLHLSDLHFGYERKGAETPARLRERVLDGMVRIVRDLGPESKPQMVAISGDLTYQGQERGYAELETWLRDKLLPAADVAPSSLVICPGNHDIIRDETAGLVGHTHDAKLTDSILQAEKLTRWFAPAFAHYTAFAERFGIPAPQLHGKPNRLAGTLDYAASNLRFLCLNSAWFCRDSRNDNNHLWLGGPHLRTMGLLEPEAGEYNSAPVTIALVHHPHDWFAPSEKNAYDGRPASYEYLAQRCHAILSGHTHGAIQDPTPYYNRAWLFLNGAAYDNDQYPNHFSLLRIDTAARHISRRNWEFDSRFERWEERRPSEHPLRREPVTTPQRPAADPAKYLKWLREFTQDINLDEFTRDVGKLPPPSIDDLYIQAPVAGAAGLEDVLRQPGHLLLHGKPGSGKTTFLRWLAWQLCRPAGPPPDFPVQDRMPLFIRISELDEYIANTLADKEAHGKPPTAVDGRWLPHFLAAKGWGLDEAFFTTKLAAPDTLLLLDGLDEAAGETRRLSICATDPELRHTLRLPHRGDHAPIGSRRRHGAARRFSRASSGGSGQAWHRAIPGEVVPLAETRRRGVRRDVWPRIAGGRGRAATARARAQSADADVPGGDLLPGEAPAQGARAVV